MSVAAKPDNVDREDVPEPRNPLGMAGIEFVEYSTSRPQALGQSLEKMGFRPIARHRSREVILYRQGSMNLVVNSEIVDSRSESDTMQHPRISAVAFRVQDAHQALQRCVDLGAWQVPSRARAMELHIPGIHGPGGSHFYFVDRWDKFSIYDIDFVPIPTVDQSPPAVAGDRYFGVVQYVDNFRTIDWIAYYERLFGFTLMPDDERFGILPNGSLMRSACGQFLWQLVAPIPWQQSRDTVESLRRIGIGTADVESVVSQLKGRGVAFVDSAELHPDDRGALTRTEPGGVAFELVHQDN